MAKSTGIVLATTGIVVANKWVNTNQVDFKIAISGGILSLFMAGVERITPTGAVGISFIGLITALVMPPTGYPSVFDTINNFINPAGPANDPRAFQVPGR